MNSIFTAVVTALLIGIIGYIGKKAWDMICSRNNDHKLMRKLPDFFKLHTEEHETIKDMLETTTAILEENRKDNMELQKRQLLDSYEKAKERGYWSLYEKEAWLSMYDRYEENGGNSFVEDIKETQIELITIK